jgi:hypothetical protein
MNTVMWWWVLGQANAGRVRGIRDSFGDTDSGGGAGGVILFFLLAALVVLLAYAWLRAHQTSQPVHNAFKLFEDALGSLGLSGEDRSLLKRMVRDLRLEQPAQLLLNAGHFDRTVDKWVATSSPKERGQLAERLAEIRRKTFSKQP